MAATMEGVAKMASKVGIQSAPSRVASYQPDTLEPEEMCRDGPPAGAQKAVNLLHALTSKRWLTLMFNFDDDPKTQSQQMRCRVDMESRYVFLCPATLSAEFDSIPQHVKDTAILVFKCSRDWVFPPPRNARVITAKVQSGAHKQGGDGGPPERPPHGPMPKACFSEFNPEFQRYVYWRETEGCVFWLKPDRDMEKLSEFFESLTSHDSNAHYNPLILNPQWWRARFPQLAPKFVGSSAAVLANLQHIWQGRSGEINVPGLQELIYQSNPSLMPVVHWPRALSMRFTPKVSALSTSKDSSMGNSRCLGYISCDTNTWAS